MALLSLARYGYGNISPAYTKRLVTQLQGFTITGPLTGASANTVIAAPITARDTIAKVMMFASGVPSDITSTTAAANTFATGTLTLSGVVATNACTVAGKVYTAAVFTKNFVNGTLPQGQFAVGTTDTLTAVNLAAAINADGSQTVVATPAAAVVTLTAKADSTPGNAITLVGGTHITASGATLAGGSATKGIKSTTDTSSNTVLVFWYPNA